MTFISLRSHHAIVVALEQAIAAERKRADETHRLLVDLTAKYHQLKLGGAVTVETTQLPERKPIDPVITAINAKAPTRTHRLAMLAQAQADRQMGKPESDILRDIEQGVPSEGIVL